MRKSILNSTESSSDAPCKRSVTKEEKVKNLPLEKPTNDSDDLNKQCIYITSNDDNIISPPHNKNTSSVYICPNESKMEGAPTEGSKHARRLSVNMTNNKIEIDSDNIETPPTVRKSFSGSIKKTNIIEHVPLGDGQFDRFSSARRTRRFKRPTDLGASNTGDELSLNQNIDDILNVKENDIAKETKNASNDVVARIGKIGKSISKISQEDVREAIRSLKSPTPEHEWKLKEPLTAPSVKITTHELNDEGFEETQSLVSDTPSLTTSSCNEDSKSKKVDNSEPATVATNAIKRKPIRPSNQLQTLLSRNQQSLERSRSLRNATNLSAPKNTTSIIQRTNSLRKSDDVQQKFSLKSVATNKRLDVERSNSRTSLRSSRSSLNSAISTNTIKKMPQKISSTENAQSIAKTRTPLTNVSKDSLGLSKVTSPRVPASRSSSSGSSIQSLRKPPVSVTKLPSPNVLPPVRSKISPPSLNTRNEGTTNPRPNTNSNFMRPTTATKARQKIKPK